MSVDEILTEFGKFCFDEGVKCGKEDTQNNKIICLTNVDKKAKSSLEKLLIGECEKKKEKLPFGVGSIKNDVIDDCIEVIKRIFRCEKKGESYETNQI